MYGWLEHAHRGVSEVLGREEVVVCKEALVGIYENEVRSRYQKGWAILTTHRILYEPAAGEGPTVSLNLSAVVNISQTSGFGSWSHPKITISFGNTTLFSKLSFRNGGCAPFFAKLGATLKRKEWNDKTIATAKERSATTTNIASANELTDANAFGLQRVMQKHTVRVDDAKLLVSTQIADSLENITTFKSNALRIVHVVSSLRARAGCGSLLLSVDDVVGAGMAVNSHQSNSSLRQKMIAIELFAWISAEKNALSKKLMFPLQDLFSMYNLARPREDPVMADDFMAAVKVLVQDSLSRLAAKGGPFVALAGCGVSMHDSVTAIDVAVAKAGVLDKDYSEGIFELRRCSQTVYLAKPPALVPHGYWTMLVGALGLPPDSFAVKSIGLTASHFAQCLEESEEVAAAALRSIEMSGYLCSADVPDAAESLMESWFAKGTSKSTVWFWNYFRLISL